MKIFLPLALLATCTASAQQTDWEKAGLKGRVYTVSKMTDSYNGSGVATRLPKEFATYNGKGMIVSELLTDNESLDVLREKQYAYKDGLLKKRTDDVKNGLLAGITEEQFVYNENGKLIQVSEFSGPTGATPTKMTEGRQLEYDAKGNCTREKRTSYGPSRMEDITQNTYDASGRKTRKEYFRNGKRWQYIDYTYNKKDQVQTETSFGDDGHAKTKFSYLYDDEGHVIRTDEVSFNYPTDAISGTRVIQETYAKGLKTSSITRSSGEKDSNFQYEYGEFDKQGNWGTKKTVLNGKVFEFVKRRVDYF